MQIRPLTREHLHAMWSINEQGLPGTGKVSEDEMEHLLNVSSFARGAFSDDVLLGFVIRLPPQADYGSLNYAWFNARYDGFIYVDRVAVASESRNRLALALPCTRRSCRTRPNTAFQSPQK